MLPELEHWPASPRAKGAASARARCASRRDRRALVLTAAVAVLLVARPAVAEPLLFPNVNGPVRMLCTPLVSGYNNAECEQQIEDGLLPPWGDIGYDGPGAITVRTTEFLPATQTEPMRTLLELEWDISGTWRGGWVQQPGGACAGDNSYVPDHASTTLSAWMSWSDFFTPSTGPAIFAYSDLFDFTITNPPGGLHNPGGTARISVNAIWDRPQSGTGRAPITSIVVTDLWPVVAGATTDDPCRPFSFFATWGASSNPWKARSFGWQEGSLPLVAGPTGALAGRVYSTGTLALEPSDQVQRADVSLWRQRRGWIRPPGPAETQDEYATFVRERRAERVGVFRVEVGSDGQPKNGLDFGEFHFDGLPTYAPNEAGDSRVWMPVYYLLEVSGAESVEPNAEAPGGQQTVSFRTELVPNLQPDAPFLQVGVDPFSGTLPKRELAAKILTTCNANLTAAESDVVAWLDALDGGGLELTGARDEALRRAILAEQVVAGGLEYSDAITKLALVNFGAFVADLFDEFVSFEAGALTRSKKRVAEREGQFGPMFDLGTKTGRRKQQQYFDDLDAVVASESAGVMKAWIKAAQPKLVDVFTKDAEDPEQAKAAADLYFLVIKSILAAAEAGAREGGAKPLLKKAINDTLVASQPLLMDLTQAPSVCEQLIPSLEFTASSLDSWSVDDWDDYVIDRRQVREQLTRIHRIGGQHVNGLFAAAEFASALDEASDVYSALSIGGSVKAFEGASKVAAIARSTLNGLAGIGGVSAALLDMPDEIQKGVELAWRSPPLESLASQDEEVLAEVANEIPAVPLSDLGSRATALAAVWRQLADHLLADELAEFLDLAAEGNETGLLTVYPRWMLDLHALIAQVGDSGSNLVNLPRLDELTTARLEFIAVEASAVARSQELGQALYVADYTGTGDPAYQKLRDKTAAGLLVLAQQLEDLGAVADEFALYASGVPTRAVLIAEAARFESSATGEDYLSQSPEGFQLRVTVRNPTDVAVPGASLALDLSSPDGGLAATGPVVVALPELSANDGVVGSGGDEVEVSFDLGYSGPLDGLLHAATLRFEEAGEEPSGFSGIEARAVLRTDPELVDADYDFMPDLWELDHGLDTATDDALLDLDGDGVPNGAERRLGLLPEEADSDADGLSDGEELEGGSDGFITDPLVADTDEDGTDDGADGSPLDGATADPGSPPAEVLLKLSRSKLYLGPDVKMDAAKVSGLGGGILRWVAEAEDPDLIATDPFSGELRHGEGMVFAALRDGIDFDALPGPITTRIRVRDLGGVEREIVTLDVVISAVPEPGAVLGAVVVLATLALMRRLPTTGKHRDA